MLSFEKLKRDNIEVEKFREEMIEKLNEINYKNTFGPSGMLIKQSKDYPESFYIQVLGNRGAGKSTFINRILAKLKGKGNFKRAKTGDTETTLTTDFYDISGEVKNMHQKCKRVFLVDQPGIGGQEVHEADYLERFSPG